MIAKNKQNATQIHHKLINHGNTPWKRLQQKKYEPNQRTQIIYCMTHNLHVFTLFKVFPFLTYLLL
jgi:hypothetical protein